MKNAPYSMRFSPADQSAIAAYCEQNGITLPTESADVKALFMQALAKPTPADAVPVEKSEAYAELLDRYNTLSAHNAELATQLDKVDETEAQHVEEVNGYVRRITELEAQVQTLAATDENTLVIPLEANVKKLLDVTVERLSEKYAHKYPNGVTPALILVDMFLRYTRHQETELFYPFVIPIWEAKKILKGE